MVTALSTKQPELTRLKAALKAKQAELLSELGNREGIAIEPAADDFDKIQYGVCLHCDESITEKRLTMCSAWLAATATCSAPSVSSVTDRRSAAFTVRMTKNASAPDPLEALRYE